MRLSRLADGRRPLDHLAVEVNEEGVRLFCTLAFSRRVVCGFLHPPSKWCLGQYPVAVAATIFDAGRTGGTLFHTWQHQQPPAEQDHRARVASEHRRV